MTDAPAPIVALAEVLGGALREALDSGRLENPEGWAYAPAEPRRFGRWCVLVALAREGEAERRTLGLLVAPTDPAEPAYRRTRALDLVYFSEDVPDPEQARIYARDRATIDRFWRWLAAWDDIRG